MLNNINYCFLFQFRKIETRKLEWSTESKIGSLENAAHIPGGGNKKVQVFLFCGLTCTCTSHTGTYAVVVVCFNTKIT